MTTDCMIGGGTSALKYRHPLISSISPFLACLQDMPDPVAKRRVRWTPMAASMAAVLMAWDRGCPLCERFEDAQACMTTDFARRTQVGKTYNGLVKALERQAPQVLPVLKADLRRQVLGRLQRMPGFSKWFLMGVDGSKEELPRTKDHENVFGLADNGAIPQALITTIVEVHTGLPWDWRIDHSRASEKDHLIQMAPDLAQNTLLLGDGNFVGFPVWSKLDRAGKEFLIRVGGNVHLIKQLWPEVETHTERDIVYVWPKNRQRRVPPLKLRLIKVGRGRQAVYLLTNVLDRRRLSKRAAGQIYRLRWGAELFYRTFKRTLGYAKLQSKASRRARMELEWGLIAMTIATMLGIDAASENHICPGRLSHAQLFRTLRGSLLRGASRTTRHSQTGLTSALASSLKDTYCRRKPKRSRHRTKTKNTPRPLILKPPQIRRATPEERKLAMQYLRSTAA